MDAYGFVMVLLVVLSSTNLSSQMVQEDQPTVEGDDNSSLSSTPASTISANSEVANQSETACINPKKLDGACVTRQMCEYSTPAIDLTLYSHRGYRNPCTLGEVCCPVGALKKVEETTMQPIQDFEFDEDD